MADYNYVELGQANLSGDIQALFRDTFVPYLLTTFDTKRIMKNLVRNKTITKGKSASFPLFGTMGAKYYKRGEEISGAQTIAKNEVTINIDPYLIADAIVYELDEKMSETQDREILADELATALANQEDKTLLQVGVLAARSGSLITNENRGGAVIKDPNMETDSDALVNGIYAAGVAFDEKDVPEEGRICALRPFQYSLLLQNNKIINKDIGTGSFAKGVSGAIDNIQILKTNHLPNSNIEKDEAVKNTYEGDFSNTVGLVFTRDAIATVTLMGLKGEVSWNPRFLHHLMTFRIAQGHGFLRPECAVELSKEASE